MSGITINGTSREWRPHTGQQKILKSTARFRVAACGRRWGKSENGSVIALQWAKDSTKRNPVWWVAPTYDLCEPGLDASEELYPPEWIAKTRTAPGNMGIDFVWGGVLEFKSAEKERTLRGRGLRGLLVEEAGEIKDGVWDILRPTLADFRAPAFIFGTPKGRNWFWKLAVRGMGKLGEAGRDPDVEFFSEPTEANPFIDKREIEEERRRTPDRIFRQEWMAEFVADSGGVFPNPRRLVKHDRQLLEAGLPGEQYVIGWDPAKQHDYSVVTVDRVSDRHTVHWQRWQKVPYTEQTKRVAAIARLFNNAPVTLEVNNTGDPVHELLVAEGVEVWPFKTTHASKQNIINNLSVHIGEGSTSWPDLPILTNELEIYEWKTNGGTGAPDGWHDDAVMSKALADWGITRGASFLQYRDHPPTESITDFL